MPMTSLVSDAQLDRYLSAFGVTMFADHDDDGIADTSVVDDCKNYGTSYVVGALSSATLRQSRAIANDCGDHGDCGPARALPAPG